MGPKGYNPPGKVQDAAQQEQQVAGEYLSELEGKTAE